MLVFMLLYGGSRQMYRHNALNKHQQLVAANTAEFQKLSKEAREHPVEEKEELELDASLGKYAKGGAIFKQKCGVCHKKDEKLVGPPMLEMVNIYKGKVSELKNWIKEPGKKRADFPQMPSFKDQLSDEELNELTAYILSIK